MKTFHATLEEEILRDFEPRLILECKTLASAFIRVTDYTLGGGNFVRISLDGSPLATVTEGTHFSAVTSNEVTAQNIAQALRLNIPGAIPQDQASIFAIGNLVVWIDRYAATAVFSTDDSLAYDPNSIAPIPGTLYLSQSSFRIKVAPNHDENIVEDTGIVAGEIYLEPDQKGNSTGEVTFIIEDPFPHKDVGWFRDLMTRQRWKSKRITLHFGAANVAEANYGKVNTYWVTDAKPTKEGVELVCFDREPASIDQPQDWGRFFNVHLLDLLTYVYDKVGIRYKSSSFDRSAYAATAIAFSHWAFGLNPKPYRAFSDTYEGIGEVSIRDLESICTLLLPGVIFQNSDGEREFKLILQTATADLHFNTSEVEDIAYESMSENVHSISKWFGALPGNDQRKIPLQILRDELSSLLYSSDRGEPFFEKALESKLIGFVGYLYESIGPSATQIKISQGFSGTRGRLGGMSCSGTRVNESAQDFLVSLAQDATDKPSAARPVYLMLEGDYNAGFGSARAFSFAFGNGSISNGVLTLQPIPSTIITNNRISIDDICSVTSGTILSATSEILNVDDNNNTISIFVGMSFPDDAGPLTGTVNIVRRALAREIIRCDAIVDVKSGELYSTTNRHIPFMLPYRQTGTGVTPGETYLANNIATFTISERGSQGVPKVLPADWMWPKSDDPNDFDPTGGMTIVPAERIRVYDVTPLIVMGNYYLDWLSHGAPIAESILSAKAMKLEPGDVITFDDAVYANFELSSGDSSTRWLVSSYPEPLFFGSGSGVRIRLFWLNSDTPLPAGARTQILPPELAEPIPDSSALEPLLNDDYEEIRNDDGDLIYSG